MATHDRGETRTADRHAFADRPALLDAGGTAVSHAALAAAARSLSERLAAARFGPGSRIAIVCPDTPAMAVSFLGVSLAATAAPLNPRMSSGDFEFAFSDFSVAGLLTEHGFSPAAEEAARNLSIPVISAPAAPDFRLPGPPPPPAPGIRRGAPDVALVLHTSGTTARPKVVPLTRGNIAASAASIARSLRLSPDDRLLNAMPLFHIHGLMTLMATLHAGGSAVLPGPFDADSFVSLMERLSPTWYSAVPTIHKDVLAALSRRTSGTRANLRFVRSGSSALPPALMDELERTFAAPVIEAYGMTEACNEIASSPLPPGIRKAGSVGFPTGSEAVVLDAGGRPCVGAEGEIAVRGPAVMSGYENNPSANDAAFADGWFRTGDLGRMDADGRLFITGRLKEIINRGGEKVSPREVDEAVGAHPGVLLAVCFAVPHPRLGEDVAVAVVMKPGAAATRADIVAFAARRLAPHKVPRHVLFTPSIPKGPSGKLRRIGLADLFSDLLRPPYAPPASPEEETVARVFSEVLDTAPVGRHDSFFALGGDSLLAARATARLSEAFGRPLDPTTVFRHASPAELAAYAAAMPAADPDQILAAVEAITDEEARRLLDDPAGLAGSRPPRDPARP